MSTSPYEQNNSADLDVTGLTSSKDASEKFGVTNDYIARLARGGKIEGKLVNRTWYVREDSLSKFLKGVQAEKKQREEDLSRARREEYLANQNHVSAVEASTRFGVTNDYITRLAREGKVEGKRIGRTWYVDALSLERYLHDRQEEATRQAAILARARKMEYARGWFMRPRAWLKTAAVALIVSLVTSSTYAALLPASAAQDHPRLAAYGQVVRNVTGTIGDVFSAIGSLFTSGDTRLVDEPGLTQPAVVNNTYNTYNNTYHTTNNNEHITYEVTQHSGSTIAGITNEELQQELNSLAQQLRREITPNTNPSSGGVANNIALTQRIDNLNGVTINNSTVNGLSGLTDDDIPDDITASQYLALSGGTLTGLVHNTATGTSNWSGSLSLGGSLTVAGTTTLNGPLADASGSVGANGYILQSTGTSTQWVATSTLGFGTGSGSGTVASGTAGQVAYYAADGTTVSGTSSLFISGDGNVGVGTTSPASKLQVLATSTPQFRIGYDTTSYADFSVASNGNLTIAPTGSFVVTSSSTFATTTVSSITVSGAFNDANGSAGANGSLLQSTGTSTNWVTLASLGFFDTAGTGLSATGTTISLDIDGLIEESTFESGDFLAFYDTTAGVIRKVDYDNLPGAGGGITSLNGLSVANQFFATSTAVDTFGFSSTGSTHTLTIPSNVGFFTNDAGYLTSISTSTVRSFFSASSPLSYNSSTGVFSVAAGFEIPSTASTSDWQTAFEWGDHSGAGYLVASNNLSDLASTTVARTNLGLGDLAVLNDLSTFDTGDLSEGSNLYFTNARAREAISETIPGISYATTTGVFSLDGSYTIPLSASTTNWETFYQTPSNRITAGTLLSWAGNTLNVDDDLANYDNSNTGFITGNETITLSGDVTGSGTTSIVTTIAAGAVGDDEIDYGNVTLNDLTFDVGSVSKTEFGYLDGVTSAIQAQIDSKLSTTTAASTYLAIANNLSDLASTTVARTNLGLGTIATQDANNVAITGGTLTGVAATTTSLSVSGNANLATTSISNLTIGSLSGILTATGGLVAASSTIAGSYIEDVFLRNDGDDTTTGVLTAGGFTTAGTVTFSSLTGGFLRTNGSGVVSTSSIDISDDTNLAVTATGLTLNDDTIELTAGYIIPLSASTTNWETAFGWGDHSAAGYLVASNNLSDVTNATTSRTNLGLGSIALLNSIDISDNTNLAVTATGLTLNGDTIELNGSYTIPLTASTTNWNTFYNTPSNRITAGTDLSWSGNTLNFDNSTGYITGVAWGDITGTLSNQTDLQNALDAKLSTTTAANTYLAIANNLSDLASSTVARTNLGLGSIATQNANSVAITGGTITGVAATTTSLGVTGTATLATTTATSFTVTGAITVPAGSIIKTALANSGTLSFDWTDSEIVDALSIAGGTINNTPIGASSASTAIFTNATSTNLVTTGAVTFSALGGGLLTTDANGVLSTTTDSTLTQEQVEDYTGTMVSGNTETLITVTYQDADGTIDFVVDNNLANYDNSSSNFITLTDLSSTATGLTYTNTTGVFSLTSGYEIPLTASTTNWNSFYNTPSTRITAGDGIDWSGNTLNVTGVPASSLSLTHGYVFRGNSSNVAEATSTIFIADSGNVGIGTTSPASSLVVQSGSNSTNASGGISIFNSANTQNSGWRIFEGESGNYDGYLMFAQVGSSTPGNIAITPTGAVQFPTGAGIGDGYSVGSLSSGSLAFYEPFDGTDRGFLNFRGAAPGQGLFKIQGWYNDGSWNRQDIVDFVATSSGQYAQFANDVYVDGNVGIGDTSPLYALTVGNGDLFGVATTGAISTATGITSSGTITLSDLTGGFLKTNGSGVVSTSTIDLTADITGTLPVANGGTGATTLTGLLLGNGTSAFTATTTLSASYIEDVFLRNDGDTATGDYTITGTLGVTGTTTLATSGGRVGIGTNTPDYALDVAGNAGFDEYLYHNDDSDTYWRYLTDRIAGVAGGETLVDIFEGAQDYVKLGDGGDVDINLAGGVDGALFIEGSSGYVGLGTTTPSEKLHIYGGNILADRGGSAGTQRTLTLGGAQQSAGTDYAQLNFQNWDNNDASPEDYVGARISSQNQSGAEYGDLRFSTSWNGTLSEQAIINATGLFGIGTTTPVARLAVQTGGTTDILNLFETGGEEVFTVLENGNVGIGATGPNRKLVQYESDSGTSNYHQFISTDTGSASTDGLVVGIDGTENGIVWNYENKPIIFGANNDEKLRINNDGNVGIGDSSPTALLTVGNGDLFQVATTGAITAATGITSSGTITFSGITNGLVYANGSGVLSSTSTISSSLIEDAYLRNDGDTASGDYNFSSNTLFVDDSEGAVSVGIADTNLSGSAYSLRVSQNTTKTDTSEQYLAFFGSNESNQPFGLSVSQVGAASQGDRRVILDAWEGTNGAINLILQKSGGNIGIGDTSPAYALTVGNGDLFGVATTGAIAAATGITSSGTITLSDLTGGFLKTNGSGVLATSTIDLTADITGTLPVANGGTGATTLTGLLLGNGTSAFTATTTLSAGYIEDVYLRNDGDTGNGNYSLIGNVSVGTTTQNARLTVQSTGTADILNLFETDGTEVFTVLENGNVGIGNSSPSSALEVGGDIELSITGTIGYGNLTNEGYKISGSDLHYFTRSGHRFYVDANNNSNDAFEIYGNVAEGTTTGALVTVLDTGNVGIGTTSPASTLDVWGDLRVGTSSTPTLFTDVSTGYVGLGTDTPSAPLAIHNNSNLITFSPSVIQTGAPGLSINSNRGNSNADISLRTNDGSGLTTRLFVQADGNIGIGDTSPAALLTVGNGDLFQVATTGAITAATGITSSGTITFSDLTGGFLKTNGSGVLSTSTIDLTADITGTLSVANGGTGATSLTGLLLGNGTSAFTATTTLSSSYIEDVFLRNDGDTASGDYNFDSNTLVIDSADNQVGIGTASPTESLMVRNGNIFVSSPDDLGGVMIHTDNTAGMRALYSFGLDATNQQKGLYFDRDSGSVGLANNTTSSFAERLTVTTSGLVGIGTTSPTSLLNVHGGDLHISSGGTDVAPDMSNLTGLLITSNGSANTFQALRVLTDTDASNIEALTVTNAGNVGLGTTTPGAKLQVLGTGVELRLAHAATQYHDINVVSDGGLTWSPNGTDADVNFDFSGATDGDFSINTDDLFVDTSTGQVGIGTTTPGFSLDVDGDVRINDTLNFTNSQGDASNITANFGNLTVNLDATHGFRIVASGGNEPFKINANAADDAFEIQSDGDVIANAGNVGIGTTSPTELLHVAGDTRIEGALYDSSNSAGSAGQILQSLGTSGFNWVATSSVFTDTTLSQEQVEDYAGGMLTGNTETLITVTYQDADGTIDFVVDNDLANYSNATANFFDTAGTGLTSTGSTVNVTGVLEDLNTLGAPASDGQFIVATGAGAFAYESGATARTSLGLGTGDSPTFTGLTLSGVTNGLVYANGSGVLSSTSTISSSLIEDVYLRNDGDTATGNYTFDSGTLFIDASSNRVGIGTTSPNTALEVAGIGRFTGTGGFSVGNDSGQIRIHSGGSSAQPFNFLNASNGYTGINVDQVSVGSFAGTDAPANGLLVSGNVGVGTTTTNARFTAQSTGTSDILNLFETGGEEVFTVLENGSVGIGDSSPQDILSVKSTDSTTHTALNLLWEHLNTTTDIEERITWQIGDDATPGFRSDAAYIGAGKEGSHQSSGVRDTYLSFGTEEDDTLAERVRITAAGLVGIGTTSPASKLDVWGDFRVGTSSIPALFVDVSSGNVGINRSNLSSLTSKLEVQGTAANDTLQTWRDSSGNVMANLSESGDAGYAEIGYAINASGASGSRDKIILNGGASNAGASITLYEGGSTASTIRLSGDDTSYFNAGNVGIGDTSPSALLTVGNGDLFQVASTGAIAAATGITSSGTITFSGITNGLVYANGSGVLSSTSTISSSLIDDVYLRNDGDTATGNYNFDSGTLFVDASNDRIGIGTTTPTDQLSIVDTNPRLDIWDHGGLGPRVALGVYTTGGDPNSAYLTTRSSVPLRLGVNSSSILTIATSSNVGIGTTNPQTQLEVLNTGSAVLSVVGDSDNNGSSIDSAIRIYNNGPAGTGSVVGELLFDESDNTLEISRGSGQNHLTIDSSGNVGVGIVGSSWLLSNTTNNITDSDSHGVNSDSLVWEANATGYAVGARQINTASNAHGLIVETEGTASTNHIVTFRSGTTDRFTVTGAGNVGIGTTSPSNNLHIFTDTSGEGLLVDSLTATVPVIDLGSYRGASADAFIGELRGFWDGGEVAGIVFETGDDTTNRDDGRITFQTALAGNSPAERMRIEPNGNVGIGDTSPTYALTVGNGDLFGVATTGAIVAATGITSSGTITLSDLTGGFLKTNGSGVVSTSTIDLTTDITGTLPVANGGTGATTLTGLLLGNGTSAFTATTTLSAGYIEDVYLRNDGDIATGDYNFSSAALFIDDSEGRVGIGTTTPDGALTIYETAISNPFRVYSNSWNSVALFNSSDNSASITVSDDDTTSNLSAEGGYTSIGGFAGLNASNLNINNTSGYVGIGTTSPAYKVDIWGTDAPSGSIRAVTSSSNNGLLISSTNANASARNYAVLANSLAFGDFAIKQSTTKGGDPTSGTSRFYIDASGNVGIGTTTPGETLDVWGDIGISNSNYLRLYDTNNSQFASVRLNSGTVTANYPWSFTDSGTSITTTGGISIGDSVTLSALTGGFLKTNGSGVVATSTITESDISDLGTYFDTAGTNLSSTGSTVNLDDTIELTGASTTNATTTNLVVTSTVTLPSASVSKTALANSGTLSFDWADSEVADALTISSSGSVDSTALTDGGTISFDWVDDEIADAITISGGTIGSNSISGTLTTTGTLTIGDGGDRIDISSDSWDVTNGLLTGLTGLTSSGTITFSSVTNGILVADGSGVVSASSTISSSNIEDVYLRNDGDDTTTGTITALSLTTSSSTATTTIAGGLNVNSGSILHDWSTGQTSIANLALGALTFDADAGIISWVDMPVTSAATTGTIESYSAQIDGTPLLTVYSESDGSGGIQNSGIGIGTTTPGSRLTVAGESGDTRSLFTVASSTGTSYLTITSGGNVGIGSSTPSSLLTVAGNSYLGGTLTATGAASLSSTLAVTGTSTLATTTITDLTASGAVTFSALTGGFLKTNGSGVLSTSTIDLTADITGTLPVANGGTGATSLTGLLIGNGTSAFTATTTLSSSYIEDVFLRNDGDTATGDYNFDSNTLVIDSTNNRVGIGTTSPAYAFQVAPATGIAVANFKAAGATSMIDIGKGSTANQISAIRFKDSGTNGWSIGSDGTDSNSFKITRRLDATLDGASLAITTGGLVGIGTTSPDSLLHLSSNVTTLTIQDANSAYTTGTADIEFLDNGTQGVMGSIGYSGDGNLTIDQNNPSKFIALTGSNVGIGTTSPATKLHVYTGTNADHDALTLEGGNTGASYVGLLFKAGGTADEYAAIRADAGDEVNGGRGLTFWGVNGAGGSLVERVRINSDGNVGIGTSSPVSKLQVAGDINVGYQGENVNRSITVHSSSASNKTGTITHDGGSFIIDGGVANQNLELGEDGSSVFSDIILSSNGNDANRAFAFEIADVDVLRIDGSGRVGIGTTTPSALLSVGATSSSQFLVNDVGVVTDGTWNGDAIGYSYLSLTNSILEADLKAVDTASDEECLTYEATGGDFEWQSCGGGISFGSDNQIPYTNSSTDDFDYSSSFTFDGSTLTLPDLTISSGSMVFSTAATTTIVNNNAYAWTLATSTTGSPLLRVDTTSGSEQVIVGKAGGDVYIGDVGAGSNLIFEEDSTIHGQGTNTLTFGQGGDVINFAVNTGFGTSTPAAKVDIWGSSGSSDSLLSIASSSGSSYLTVTSAGNVGIGTETPSDVLTVSGGDIALDTGQGIVSGNNSIQVNTGSGNGLIVTSADQHFFIDSNANESSAYFRFAKDSDTPDSGTELMRIQENGRVGIGDSSPDHLLDVAGNIGLATSSYINFGDTDGTSGYGFRDNSGTLQFKNSGGSWTNFGTGSGSTASPVAATFYDNTGGQTFSAASYSTVNIDTTLTNSSSTIISLASDEVTVSADGYYEVSFEVTGQLSSGTRSGLQAKLQLDTGGGYSDVDGSYAFHYGRITTETEGTAGTRVVLSLSSGDKLRIQAQGTTESFTAVADGSRISISKFGGAGSGVWTLNGSNAYFNSGNVGIGTTTPGAKLDVFGGNTIVDDYFYIRDYDDGTISNPTRMISRDGNFMFWNGGVGIGTWSDGIGDFGDGNLVVEGSIGIGTTTPPDKLSVVGTGIVRSLLKTTTTGSTNAANFVADRGDQANGYAGLIFKTDGTENWTLNVPAGTSDLRLYNHASTTELLRFTTGGNLGIGDTTPDAKFEMVGTSTLGYLAISSAADNDGDIFTVDEDGNVGIGTSTPERALHIRSTVATILLDRYNLGADLKKKFIAVDVIGNLAFGQFTDDLGTTTVNMVIDSSGEVGIGDVTPDYGLDVVSDINTDDCYREAGSQVAGTCSSDENLKQNIASLSGALSRIVALNPVSFEWKENIEELGDGIRYVPGRQVGLIAQEVQQVYPHLVEEKNGYLSVRYNLELQMEAIRAIQELNSRTAFITNTLGSATTTATSTLFVSDTGRVGIGEFDLAQASTSPQYDLHVTGDVAAQSFVNISTRDEKDNITEVSGAEDESMLDKLSNLFVAKYTYKRESATTTPHLGLIAEEAPEEVLAEGGKGVDLYRFVTFLASAMKALQRYVVDVGERLAAVEERLANIADGAGTSVAAVLERLGATVNDGWTTFSKLATANFTVGSTEQPSGITLYDEVTGEPYCVKIKDGVMVHAEGDCSVAGGNETVIGGNNPGGPVITVRGNNPAYIAIGANYSDLGASAVDADDKDLSVHTYLDGTEVDYVQLDTSTSTSYTVTYRATDSYGNTTETSRLVVVGGQSTGDGTIVQGDGDDSTASSTSPSTGHAPASQPIVVEGSEITGEGDTEVATSTDSSTVNEGETADNSEEVSDTGDTIEPEPVIVESSTTTESTTSGTTTPDTI